MFFRGIAGNSHPYDSPKVLGHIAILKKRYSRKGIGLSSLLWNIVQAADESPTAAEFADSQHEFIAAFL